MANDWPGIRSAVSTGPLIIETVLTAYRENSAQWRNWSFHTIEFTDGGAADRIHNAQPGHLA